MVAANTDDLASLRSAFAGAHGVFSVQATEGGGEVETRRGIAVADAARATGVAHLVYSSVGGADRQSGVPHFESKWRVEQHLLKIGIPASVVRPAMFMEMLAKPSMRAVLLALMSSYVPSEKPLQMIAAADIGKWVANAFAHPEIYIGKAEEIAGDELTRAEIVAVFRRQGLSAGLPLSLPKFALNFLPEDIRRMFDWFGKSGYAADISELRSRQPDLLTLNGWLSRADGEG